MWRLTHTFWRLLIQHAVSYLLAVAAVSRFYSAVLSYSYSYRHAYLAAAHCSPFVILSGSTGGVFKQMLSCCSSREELVILCIHPDFPLLCETFECLGRSSEVSRRIYFGFYCATKRSFSSAALQQD